MVHFPATKKEYLEKITIETAKMSWPGRMGGIIKEGGKKEAVEKYFVEVFGLEKIWSNKETLKNFDQWHRARVDELKNILKGYLHADYEGCEEAVAAKLLNTFLHSLMKYEQCRYFWGDLHLPLDRIVFTNLKNLSEQSKYLECFSEVQNILEKGCQKPYSIKYYQYIKIQDGLMKLINRINEQAKGEYKLTSRIELNSLMWD